MSRETEEGQRKGSVKRQVIAALRKGNCNVSEADSYITSHLSASQSKRLCQVRRASIMCTYFNNFILKNLLMGGGETI